MYTKPSAPASPPKSNFKSPEEKRANLDFQHIVRKIIQNEAKKKNLNREINKENLAAYKKRDVKLQNKKQQ